jgi:ABC-2 type transport system permease protein
VALCGKKFPGAMKQFIAFVRKEFYHIFRDKRTLLVLFGMPAAQLLLFGFAITTEVNNANIGIYNQSLGQFSSELVEKVVGGDFFAWQQTCNQKTTCWKPFKLTR